MTGAELIAVIGHFPAYLEMAKRLSARAISLSPSEYGRMSIEERWMANRTFLDTAIADGCIFRLATPLEAMRDRSYFAMEIDYLMLAGFKLKRVRDGWEMRK